MYIPASFQQTDLATLHQFIERHSFGLLCSTGEDGVPFASHLPFLLDRQADSPGMLVGHMARANPQWRHSEGKPVLVVFSGPHAYVSPSWYQAEQVVPTWNCLAVHATGILQTIHDHDTLFKIVRMSVEVYEGKRPGPWQLGERNEFLDRLLQGIVGFRIEITNLEGKWKLSQNQPAERRERVRQALQQGNEEARALAKWMEKIG